MGISQLTFALGLRRSCLLLLLFPLMRSVGPNGWVSEALKFSEILWWPLDRNGHEWWWAVVGEPSTILPNVGLEVPARECFGFSKSPLSFTYRSNCGWLDCHKQLPSWTLVSLDSSHHQINPSSWGNCLNGREHSQPREECWGERLKPGERNERVQKAGSLRVRAITWLFSEDGWVWPKERNKRQGKGQGHTEPSRTVPGPDWASSAAAPGDTNADVWWEVQIILNCKLIFFQRCLALVAVVVRRMCVKQDYKDLWQKYFRMPFQERWFSGKLAVIEKKKKCDSPFK